MIGSRTRAGLVALTLLPATPAPGTAAGWSESFEAGLLPERWSVTAAGDFEERRVEVAAGDSGGGDRRLRLRLATRGTRDDTVKFLGVRSTARVGLGEGTSISVELDWNAQANGSYLTAGLVLSPASTGANPLETDDWLKLEYVGVPPGRNARLVVASRAGGRERTLHDEGWPETNREGRPIGVQLLRIDVGAGSFSVWENGRLVHESDQALPFEAAHLYLQVSSHSNYPPREVYFDDVRVVTGGP